MSNKSPTGVTYTNNANTVEYQLFPEEYFSGCDITVYFGDTFISEISGLQFELQEKINPIFGYASRTWDTVARGSRIVTGSFKIPFKEAGYIEAVMSHIALSDNNSIPEIAYKMAGTTGPAWIADTKETIDQYLDTKSIGVDSTDVNEGNSIFKDHTPVAPGDKGEHIKEVRRLMEAAAKKFPDYYGSDPFDKDTSNPVIQYFHKEWQSWSDGALLECTKLMQNQTQQVGDIAESQGEIKPGVKELQSRMKQMIGGSITNPSDDDQWALNDGKFGTITSDVAQQICEAFKVNGGATGSAMKSEMNANNGVAPTKPAEYIAEIASLHSSADDLTRYSADMYRMAVAVKAKYNTLESGVSIKKRGTLTEEDLRNLYKDAGEEYDKHSTKKETAVKPAIGAETRYSKYEKEVWGRSFSNDPDHKYQTYFYTDRERVDGTNPQDKLKKKGFDVYITYGPSPENIIENGYKLPDVFNFNTTVKAIRNVQLGSTAQTIMVNGQPIEELYTFMGRDLD